MAGRVGAIDWGGLGMQERRGSVPLMGWVGDEKERVNATDGWVWDGREEDRCH